MPKSKPGNGAFNQILVAVAIALLVGGSAPWWWQEVKGIFRSSADAPTGRPVGQDASAERTAREFLAAWNRNDRAAALKVAGQGPVDRLFVLRLVESDRGWRVENVEY